MNKPEPVPGFSIRLIWGSLLIATGVFFLLPFFDIYPEMDWSYVWPLFLLLPGLGLWGTTIAQKDKFARAGVAIPATILSGLALLFYFHIFTDWRWSGDLAFLFPGVVALAFWVAWILSARHVGFLIPAVVLTFSSSATFIFSSIFRKLFLPALFIGLGLLVIFKQGTNPSSQNDDSKEGDEPDEKLP